MAYNIKLSESSLFEKSKSEWVSQAGQLNDDVGVMIVDDVIGIFDGVNDDPNTTYFLVKNGANYGCAILKILHAMPQSDDSWLKLLKIHLEPRLNLDDKNYTTVGDAEELIEVLAWSIIESIQLIFISDVKKLKIYGRTPIMSLMFSALLAQENLKITLSDMGLSARSEGRWLVVEKN